MPSGRFVSYLRVSTARQGASGLGLEAQRQAVTGYLNGGRWTLLREFVEIESGSRDDRPQLAAAMAECRLTGATLVIAKLDRLSRDASFLIGLEKAGIEFIAADMPQANKLTVGIMALVAQQEREAISARTKAALAAAKARGAVLGGIRPGHDRKATLATLDGGREAGRAAIAAKVQAFQAAVGPTVRDLRDTGLSLRGIAAALTERGVRTPRGGAWTAKAVSALLG